MKCTLSGEKYLLKLKKSYRAKPQKKGSLFLSLAIILVSLQAAQYIELRSDSVDNIRQSSLYLEAADNNRDDNDSTDYDQFACLLQLDDGTENKDTSGKKQRETNF